MSKEPARSTNLSTALYRLLSLLGAVESRQWMMVCVSSSISFSSLCVPFSTAQRNRAHDTRLSGGRFHVNPDSMHNSVLHSLTLS